MKVGGHVSASVSLDLAFDRAQKIEADCFQIFITPPQQWVQTEHSEQIIEKFKARQLETSIGANFIHGCYLINLGVISEEHLRKSIEWLIYSQQTGAKLGMQGTIFHLGSHKGVGFEASKAQIIEALKEILDKSPDNIQLILETSAGAGGNIGGKFSELGMLLKGVDDSRLKVCLDTQHVFAAGYDVKTHEGLEKVLSEFEEEIGLKNLVVIHANDSKADFGSGSDRHENIGIGKIGTAGFSNILKHPAFKELSFILEVPGFDNTGPDLKNIQILKSLAKLK